MARHHGLPAHLRHKGHGGHGMAHHRGHHEHDGEHTHHHESDGVPHDHVHPARHHEHGAVNPNNAMGSIHLEEGEGERVGDGGGSHYGKDHPENFIRGALTGIHGPSEGIHEYDIGHGQRIVTSVAMDNVVLAADIESSILDDKWHGGPEYLGHSLKGVSAVNEDIGAAGPVHHDYFENH
jgi:hypothetical protein